MNIRYKGKYGLVSYHSSLFWNTDARVQTPAGVNLSLTKIRMTPRDLTVFSIVKRKISLVQQTNGVSQFKNGERIKIINFFLLVNIFFITNGIQLSICSVTTRSFTFIYQLFKHKNRQSSSCNIPLCMWIFYYMNNPPKKNYQLKENNQLKKNYQLISINLLICPNSSCS